MSNHTFIICAYKPQKTLEECVKSLLNQTIKSKIIISTSTPNKLIKDIAKKYKIELVVNSGEKGHANDFRFAYSNAKTKYVTLCHQDDIYFDRFGEITIKKMNKYKNPIIAFTNYYELRNEKIIKNNKLLFVKRLINFPLLFFKKSKKIRMFTLSIGNAICAPTLTYNTEIVKTPIIDTDFKANIDWISYIEFAKLDGEFVYINKPLLARRIHEQSLTTKVIANKIMHEENYKIFRIFWSEKISRFLLKLYSKSEDSNRLK